MVRNVVYLSYDGALDPLGRSQVVPVVEGLAAQGLRMRLVTFEKQTRWADREDRQAMRERLDAVGVVWTPLRYHKRLSLVATAWDLTRALALISFACARHQVDLVHARSYPPALVAWVVRRAFGAPYVFDMRGLYADERVDGGLWPVGSRRFRATKWLEKRFLRDAQAIVTLTRASVPVIKEIERIAGGGPEPVVIPTSVDLEKFSPRLWNSRAPLTMAYFGSIGSWYLLDEMLEFGKVFLETVEGGRLLFLVNGSMVAGESPHEIVRAKGLEKGITEAALKIGSVGYDDIPTALEDVAVTCAFIRGVPSKVASAATKVSESLALGIPVAVNRSVGDSADIVEVERVGVVVDSFDSRDWVAACRHLCELARSEETRAKCRQVAEREHSLIIAIGRYRSLYEAIDLRSIAR